MMTLIKQLIKNLISTVTKYLQSQLNINEKHLIKKNNNNFNYELNDDHDIYDLIFKYIIY